jgi:hypothetical protein
MTRSSVNHRQPADPEFGQQFVTGSHKLDEAQIRPSQRGWHTAAITMRLLVDSGVPLAGGLIGLGGCLKWPRPVRPSDVLTVHREITEVTPSKPDRGTIGIKAETRNQRADACRASQRHFSCRAGAEPGDSSRRRLLVCFTPDSGPFAQSAECLRWARNGHPSAICWFPADCDPTQRP